jgi:hypothetical protein
MLKHYEVNILTKGIDLERNTLRDQVKKTNFSPWRLGDRRTHDGGEGDGSLRGGEPWGAALRALGRFGHWRGRFGVVATGLGKRKREREREKERRKTMVGGLNTPGHEPSRTLSKLTGHCPGQPNFVQPGLSIHREE